MTEDAKMAIKELVKHLGGKYTQRMSRNNSHLIIQKAMGEKWKHARAFDVIAVTPDWLVDSALAGKQSPMISDQGSCQPHVYIRQLGSLSEILNNSRRVLTS